MTLNFDLTCDLDLRFSRSFFKAVSQEREADQHGTKRWVDRMFYLLCQLALWQWSLILKVKLKNYYRSKRVDWLGMKEMRVSYNVWCTMGFVVGQKIHWPSNGSVWNSHSFQPINRLFVHWSRGWGLLSFTERLVLRRNIGMAHGFILLVCQLFIKLLILY